MFKKKRLNVLQIYARIFDKSLNMLLYADKIFSCFFLEYEYSEHISFKNMAIYLSTQ